MDKSFLENLLPALTKPLMKEHLAELEPLIVEEKIYKDKDKVGKKDDFDGETVREAFRKFDGALRSFCTMVLFELTTGEVKGVILC